MKNISFVSDEKFAELLLAASREEHMSKSLLIRSIIFSWISTNHKNLVEEIYS